MGIKPRNILCGYENMVIQRVLKKTNTFTKATIKLIE